MPIRAAIEVEVQVHTLGPAHEDTPVELCLPTWTALEYDALFPGVDRVQAEISIRFATEYIRERNRVRRLVPDRD